MTQPADFQRLYDNLKAHCVGAILQGLQPEVFECVRDFCQNTNAYNTTQNITVTAASNSYALIPLTGSAIKRVLSVADITNSIQPPFIPVKWPMGLVMPTTLQLYQQLSNTYTWQVQFSLYPVDPVDSNSNPRIPSWILDNYFDTIFSGCLYRMHVQKAKPWTDSTLAATRYRLYLKGRGLAAAEVQRQNMFNGQAWSYPYSGVTVGRQRGV